MPKKAYATPRMWTVPTVPSVPSLAGDGDQTREGERDERKVPVAHVAPVAGSEGRVDRRTLEGSDLLSKAGSVDILDPPACDGRADGRGRLPRLPSTDASASQHVGVRFRSRAARVSRRLVAAGRASPDGLGQARAAATARAVPPRVAHDARRRRAGSRPRRRRSRGEPASADPARARGQLELGLRPGDGGSSRPGSRLRA